MKKSKIIVPALAMIGLSTVASITGTVAWFTAQRSITTTAGEFGVIKTGDDLGIVLGAGTGTSVDLEDNKKINVGGSYNLTDSSFDHTRYGEDEPSVVTPDVPRAKVLSNTKVSQISTSTMNRGVNTYSAFTWTITLSVTFSASAEVDQGLFLDLTSNDTYMHEALKFENGSDLPSGVFSDPKCAASATGTADGSKTYYKPAPDATGKGFRIAFVPTAVGEDCLAYAKVWAANDGDAAGSGKFIAGVAAGNDLGDGTAYGANTVSLNHAGAYAQVTTAASSLMEGTSAGVPDDGEYTASEALTTCSNYLGYFKATPSTKVDLTFTCVAWYDGTHPNITNSATQNASDFERMVAGMKFVVAGLDA